MIPRGKPWFCLACLRLFERTRPIWMIVPGHCFQGDVCQGCSIKERQKRAKQLATSITDRVQRETGLTGVALTQYLKGTHVDHEG
jgi:hypothetical protein